MFENLGNQDRVLDSLNPNLLSLITCLMVALTRVTVALLAIPVTVAVEGILLDILDICHIVLEEGITNAVSTSYL